MKRATGIPNGLGRPAWTVLALLAIGLAGCEEGERRTPSAPPSSPDRQVGGISESQREPGTAQSPLDWADAVTGAQVDESAVRHTIHVDAAKGQDSATGGARGKPLRTLGAAAALAIDHLEAGEGVRIRLAPGTYREAVVFRPDDAVPPDAPLVIEGDAGGDVILSGSDDWSDPERWQPVEGRPGVLAAPWPHDWGDAAVEVSGRPEGEHPPGGLRGFARDDGTAVIEWKPSAGLAALAGYRVHRRTLGAAARPEGTGWQEVARLGPRTGRLLDETVRPTGPAEPHRYEYRVAALDGKGRERGTSRVVGIEPGVPDGTSRPTAVGRRREMVFVDGQLLRQVLSADALEPGTFFVDDGWPAEADDGRLYLALPRGVRRGEATLDVSVRPARRNGRRALVLSRLAAVVLRNLTVEHFAVAPRWDAAAEIEDCTQVLIEDCTFRWNNTAGLRLVISERVTLRRCAAEHNGRAGMTCMTWGACDNLLAEDIRVSHNNWRGDWGGARGGQVAGLTFGFTDRACRLRRVTATQNACPGVWVSTFGAVPSPTSARVFIEELVSTENAREGLIVSESPGPVRIRGAVLARNGASGLLIARAAGGVLEGSTLYGNRRSQIEVLPALSGDAARLPSHHLSEAARAAAQESHRAETRTPPGSRAAGPETRRASGSAGDARGGSGDPPRESATDWTWRNNTIVSTDARAPLVRAPAEAAFIRSLRSDRNLWYGPDEDRAFHLAGMGFPLEVWQQVTGRDLGSRFMDPPFRDAEALDFAPRGDSPLRRRDAWPTVAAMPANLARLAAFRAARAEATTAPPHPALAQAQAPRWHTVDLRAAANRPLTGRHAWLGSPLPGLGPGRRTLHGVPFHILDPAETGGRAAVVLRSARAGGTGGKPRPAEVTVPVDRRARTIYILHGCAGGSRFAPAAHYELVYADGTTAGVDVVPLGEAPEEEARLAERKRLATIQDSRPTFLQFTSDRARCAMMLDPDDPAGPVRYLYTLRWPNPKPDKVIRRIRLAAAEAGREVTVGVLAITLRLADEART